MSDNLWGNIITAAVGFIGVIVGSIIPWIKDSLYQRKTRRLHGAYLAVRVANILDEFVDKCVEVVQDDGTRMGRAAERDKNGFDLFIPQVRCPDAPVFPSDLDWKSIDTNLMNRILSFPNSVRGANSAIDFVGSDIASPPDFQELFEERGEQYAKLGLEALRIASVLRRSYGFKQRIASNSDWSSKRVLDKKMQEIEAIKIKRAAFNEELFKGVKLEELAK